MGLNKRTWMECRWNTAGWRGIFPPVSMMRQELSPRSACLPMDFAGGALLFPWQRPGGACRTGRGVGVFPAPSFFFCSNGRIFCQFRGR